MIDQELLEAMRKRLPESELYKGRMILALDWKNSNGIRQKVERTQDVELPEVCFDLLDRVENYKDLGGLGPDVSIQLSSWGNEGYIAERSVINLNDADFRTHVAEGKTRTEAICRLFVAVMPEIES